MVILSAENLIKIYDTLTDRVIALNGISLEISKGDMVAVMGPSGSGKSTLLHILGGIDKPTRGKVYVNRTDINALSDKELALFRNKNIGFVFQFHYLLPEFTALENVLIPVEIYQRRKSKKEKAIEILERLNLSHRLNHKPSELSGGEQQRVAIARAIINNPSVVLADEPTGNLDSKNTKNVMNILKELNENNSTTVIIATHDRSVAEYCRYILHMEDGRIIDKEFLS